jgi:phosphopantetheinyl transferase
MQAVESQTLILYHTDLRGQWPEEAARALAAKLPYGKRLEVGANGARARETLAGIALALRAIAHLTGVPVSPGALAFPEGGKPHVARSGDGAANPPDFSISHSGHRVGCAAVASGLVGFDLEEGSDARLAAWAAREAALKACGAGLAEARDVELSAGAARCRGVALRGRDLTIFADAVACVMTSVPVDAVEARGVALAELFAP